MSYLVTGSGRGLGLELVAQLSRLPQVTTVIAATRSKPSDALQKIIDQSSGKVVNVVIVITDQFSILSAVSEVAQKLAGKGLDVLVNNAGIHPVAPNGITSMDNLVEAFQVNVKAIHDMTSAFLPLLRKGDQKKVLNISSTLGSFALSPIYAPLPFPEYKVTKAALNMLTVQYAQELGKEGFTIFAISPGWLKTDMGGQYADLEVNVGAKATIDILLKSTSESNGKLLNIHVPGWEKAEGPNQYDGSIVPW